MCGFKLRLPVMVLLLPHFAAACDERTPQPASSPSQATAPATTHPSPGQLHAGASLPPSAKGEQVYWQTVYTWPSYSREDLDHELVVRSEDPNRVMELAQVKPGMVVADIGAGAGYYEPRLARAVGPTGRVVATDVQPESVALLKKRMKDPKLNPYGNVEVRLNQVDELGLAPKSVDLELMIHLDFYGYQKLLPENVRMLESCFKALKPGGRAVVAQLMRVLPGGSPDYIIANFEAAGYTKELAEEDEKGADWLFVFRRPAEPTAASARALASGDAP